MLHICLLNTNLIKIQLIQILYNLDHIDFKTHQFRIYLHSTTALWNSHLLTLHRFLKEMSLFWHFLVMPKTVSHPSFSSELDNLFPMLSLQVLHFLTISSSLGSKSQFSIHSAGQTLVSISCLDSVEEGIFSLCCSHPYDSLTSFYPASCGDQDPQDAPLPVELFGSPSYPSSQDRDFPWQDPTTVEDLFTGLKCWFAAGSKGLGRIWILKIWDRNLFP